MPRSRVAVPYGNSIFNFFKDFNYLFLERRAGRTKERKTSTMERNKLVPLAPPTGDLDHNSDGYPDRELNWQPFGSPAGAQSTEPHQPGLYI